MTRLLILVLPLLISWSATTIAANADQIRDKLAKSLPARKIEDVKPTEVAGLYQVKIDGQLVYVTPNGNYLVQGSIYEVESGKNLTTLSILNTIHDSDTIVFAPKKVNHTITVFTDTSCGYCRKLHQEVPELNANGIKVRYLLYPRAGPDSPTAATLESVWCADNPQEAITTAKAGGKIPEKHCDNPIRANIELAQQLGLRGTPMIITDNGTVIPGYKPAKALIADLNGK